MASRRPCPQGVATKVDLLVLSILTSKNHGVDIELYGVYSARPCISEPLRWIQDLLESDDDSYQTPCLYHKMLILIRDVAGTKATGSGGGYINAISTTHTFAI